MGKVLLEVFFISMAPVAELRGGIPYGLAQGLPAFPIFLVALVGNILPVPFLILFLRYLLGRGSHFSLLSSFLRWQESRLGRRFRRYGEWALIPLVAVPLPGTGAWTGALAAALLGIPLRRALPLISLGVVVAGVLVLFLGLGARAILQGPG